MIFFVAIYLNSPMFIYFVSLFFRMIAFHKFKDSSSRLLVTLQIRSHSGESQRQKGSYFVGEHKERECWCMSICVLGLNPEVALTLIKSADIAL